MLWVRMKECLILPANSLSTEAKNMILSKRSFIFFLACFFLHSPEIFGMSLNLSIPGDTVKELRAVWTFKANGSIYSSAAYDNGKVYFGSENKNVYALDSRTGNQVWAFATAGAVASTPVIYDKKLYVLSMDGRLYSLNAENGRLVWTFRTGGEKRADIWDYYLSGPAVKNGIVYFGSSDNHVYALNSKSGKLIWKFKTGNIVHSDPLIKNDTVFIGSFDGGIYALDAKTGRKFWKFRSVGDQYFPKGELQKGVAMSGNTLYGGSRDFNIYALNSITGRGKWNMKEKGSWVIATPLYYKGRIYFGTSDSHQFYCMDAGSGDVIWKRSLNMRVYGSAVQQDSTIYFGCFNGKIYGVNAEDGKFLKVFQSNGSKENYASVYDSTDQFRKDFQLYGPGSEKSESKILSMGSFLATPLIVDEILYSGSADGNFYAVKINGID